MNDRLVRMHTESLELRTKLGKLREFINSKDIRNLDKMDQDLLRRQEVVMTEYHTILETRIART